MPTDRGRAFGASRREKGRLAEAAVRGQFRALGFSVLAANYFLPSVGELDLVLNRGCFLYFVEVKSAFGPICRDPNRRGAGSRDPAGSSGGLRFADRRSAAFPAAPLRQINPIKQRRIRRTAAVYIRRHRLERYWPAFWAVGCRMTADGHLGSWQVVPMV